MKKSIKIYTPLAIAILLGSLTFVFAQDRSNSGKSRGGEPRDGRMMPPPPPHGLNPRMLEQLNLTDAQKEQIQAIETASRDASRENFDKMRGFDEQLRKIVEGGNFNEEQARQILSQKSQMMTEMEIVRLRADAAVYKILTAEQKAQLEQLKQQRPEFPPREPRGGFRPEERPIN